MRRSRPLILSGLLMLAALAIAGVLLLRSADDSLDRVLTSGVLRIGYSIEAPYAMIGRGGRITGESPETARRIAHLLGVERTEWVQLPFHALIPDLRERRIDLIASGMFITPKRAKLVRFSDPTVRVAPALLVRRGNPERVGSFGSLTRATGVKLAVLSGSVEQERLSARGWKSQNLIVVPDAQSGRAALAEGVVDALVLSAPTLRWMAKSSHDAYDVVTDPPDRSASTDLVAFAFHPDDAALQRAWNRAQSGFIGSAEHLRTIAPFGFEASDLARDLTAREARGR